MNLAVSKGKTGFTLIEILVVIAILGVVMGVVYSVYLTHQKSAYTQEEVVEVQQNLRIAMDSISRDIKMAGMLVPATTTAITAASANSISMNMASAQGVYAMVDASPDMTTVIGSSNRVTCTVKSSEDVDVFRANRGTGAVQARLLRPIDCSQPIPVSFSIYTSNRATPSLTLQKSTGLFAAGDSINRGDMIAMAGATSPDPNTVKYGVVNGGTAVNGSTCPQNQQCLVRIANCSDIDSVCYTNGTATIIAGYISSLALNYILDDSNEVPNPPDLSRIRAIRVTVTGQTSSTAQLSGGQKTRQLSTIVKIRNRRL